MTNENSILDITNPQAQLASYGGNQQVGFYDGFKAGEPALYIYIKNNSDRFTTVRRRAIERKVKGSLGDLQLVAETKLYARAYNKYLELKDAGGVDDAEKLAQRAKIKELEAKLKENKVEIPKVEEKASKAEKSAKDIKAELDALGIGYKGNASREALQELLASN